MVICWSARSMLTPLSAPSVTTRNRGAPRPGRWGLGGRWAAGRGGAWFRGRRTLATAVPNRSVRTTPIAAMTNSHKTARKATLMRVRVSAFIPCGVLGSYVACGWAALSSGAGLKISHSPVFWCGSTYYLAGIGTYYYLAGPRQYLLSCRKIIVV